MTNDLSPTSSTYGQSANGGGVRDQARHVGSEAAQAGGAVAQTAREQGTEVGREAARQARNLYGEAEPSSPVRPVSSSVEPPVACGRWPTRCARWPSRVARPAR
ncbi:hypothetical protein NKG94_44545 [Micromonospora sp. M12]